MDSHLALVRQLARDYDLKFDGSTLHATPLHAGGCRISLTVEHHEVLAAEGSTRHALMLKLASLLGLTAPAPETPLKDNLKVLQVKELCQRAGLRADQVGLEACHPYEVHFYVAGQAGVLPYLALNYQNTVMLAPDIKGRSPLALLSLIVQDFLIHQATKKAWRNRRLTKFRNQLDRGSQDMRLIRRLSPTLVQELGIPITNGILVLT